MRVLHVIDSWGVYGAENMLLNLMVEHRRLGLTSVLVCFESSDRKGRTALAAEALRRDLDICEFPMKRGYSLGAACRLWNLARTSDADIVHSHGYKGDILLGSLPRLYRDRPVVSTLHGWLQATGLKKIRLYTTLDKIFLRRLDGIINVNAAGKRIGRVDHFVVENGIPELRFDRESETDDAPDIRSFCREGFVAGCVTRFSEEKGLAFLVEAIAILSGRGIPARAVIIGDGPLRRDIEQLIARRNLRDRILVAGYRPMAFRYLPLFDVFVLPSLTEGLPITILEAMQAALPVVATRVGGIPGLLRNGDLGRLAEPRDSPAIADRLEEIFRDPDHGRAMGNRAREVALSRYSSRRMAQEYVEVYEKVLSKWKR